MKEFKIRINCSKYNLESKGDGENYNCTKCKKNVEDLSFTTLPDLVKSMENKVGTCIKIKKNQLFELNNLYRKSKAAAIATLITLGTTSCKTNTILNYGNHIGKIQTVNTKNKTSLNNVKGKIIDFYSNMPCIGVQIAIKNTEIETLSDIYGTFNLDIPTHIKDDELIQFKYLGYKSIEIEIGKIKSKEILVTLGEDPTLIGYLELQEK